MFHMAFDASLLAEITYPDRPVGVEIEPSDQVLDAALCGEGHRKTADAQTSEDSENRQT